MSNENLVYIETVRRTQSAAQSIPCIFIDKGVSYFLLNDGSTRSQASMTSDDYPHIEWISCNGTGRKILNPDIETDKKKIDFIRKMPDVFDEAEGGIRNQRHTFLMSRPVAIAEKQVQNFNDELLLKNFIHGLSDSAKYNLAFVLGQAPHEKSKEQVHVSLWNLTTEGNMEGRDHNRMMEYVKTSHLDKKILLSKARTYTNSDKIPLIRQEQGAFFFGQQNLGISEHQVIAYLISNEVFYESLVKMVARYENTDEVLVTKVPIPESLLNYTPETEELPSGDEMVDEANTYRSQAEENELLVTSPDEFGTDTLMSISQVVVEKNKAVKRAETKARGFRGKKK